MDKIKEVMGLVQYLADLSYKECGLDIHKKDEDAMNCRSSQKVVYAAIESKLRELLEREPVAYLWRNETTGQDRIIGRGMVWTSSSDWKYVGPLVLDITKDQ